MTLNGVLLDGSISELAAGRDFVYLINIFCELLQFPERGTYYSAFFSYICTKYYKLNK